MDSRTLQQRYAPEPQQVGDSHSLDIPSAEVMSQVYFSEVRPISEDGSHESTD